MAVKGPKGPGLTTPAVPTSENPAEKATENKKTRVKSQQPTSDEFDRIAESLAGNDLEFDQRKKSRRQASKRRQSTVWSRASSQRAQQTEKLQHKAEQLLHLMALQGFTQESLERHKKELAKIRKELERIQKNKTYETRALAAEKYEDIESENTHQLEKELERIEALESPLEKAYEAASLILTEGLARERRRMKIDSNASDSAVQFATTTNSSTLLLDLAGSDIAYTSENAKEHLNEYPEDSNIDRDLDIFRRLQKLINYEGRFE